MARGQRSNRLKKERLFLRGRTCGLETTEGSQEKARSFSRPKDLKRLEV